jgi:nicotinamidase-related amidase
MTDHQALIIIDMQNDYYPGGRMALDRIMEAHAHTLSLIDHARNKNIPVYFIRHVAPEDASFFANGTFGAELFADLPLRPDDPIIIKHYPNSFRETSLHETLQHRNITDLIVCGAMTHMCIDTSVRAAYDLGYSVTLVGDACATRQLEYDGALVESMAVQRSFLAALNGTFAEVISTDAFLKVRYNIAKNRGVK